MIRKKKKILLFSIILILVALISLTIEADKRLRVVANNMAQNRAKIISNNVINKTVRDYLDASKIEYSDIIKINSTEEGKVTSVEYDTVEITKIQAGMISAVQGNISKIRKDRINIPIGSLTGSQFLNSKGPTIDIVYNVSGSVRSDITSKFTSAGINQTLHQITLKVTSNVYFVMPWYRTSGSFDTEYIIAETVIVGEVPDAYTNVVEYPGSDMAGYLFDYSARN